MNVYQISPAELDSLCKIYRTTMNNSPSFIFHEFKVSQLLEAKGNRKWVLNMDMNTILKELSSTLLSLQIDDCPRSMKVIHSIKGDTIYISEKSKSYFFANDYFSVEVPRLPKQEAESLHYDIDWFDACYIDYCEVAEDKSINITNSRSFDYCIQDFNKKRPVDVLIADNQIIGFEQSDKIFKPNGHNLKGQAPVHRADADIILRSYNFPFPRNGLNHALTRVKRNGDGIYWLALESKTDFTGVSANFYEHLEVIR